MNAKWLIALGLLAMLVLAGCPQGDGGSSNDTRPAMKVGEGEDAGGGDAGGGDAGGAGGE